MEQGLPRSAGPVLLSGQRKRTAGALALVVMVALTVVAGCTPAALQLESAPARGVARRVVSLAPNTTEMLYALGAGGQIVASTASCNYPPEARALPRIGDMHVDVERVVAMAPDLVVAEWLTPPDLVRRLRALGLRVLQVDSSTIDGYLETLGRLGERTGHPAEAARLSARLTSKVGALRRRLAEVPMQRRPRVFIEIWGRPLQTAACQTFIDEMIRLAGGVNVFGELEQYPRISPEALLSRDPDVVLLTSSSVEAFAAEPGLGSLRAVRNRRVWAVDPDTLVRPGPRLTQALDGLTRMLTP